MFVLAKSANYFWPVSISLPASGGKFEKHVFDAHFKRLAQSHVRKLIEGAESGTVTDLDFCREVLVGWKGIQDGDGQEVPFSETSLIELLEIPMVAKSIVLTYMESIAGAPRKN